MAAIPELTEDFEAGAVGAALTTTNSNADGVFPEGPGTFTDLNPYLGTRALNVTTSAQNFAARFNHTLAGGWRGFAFRAFTPDLTDTAVANWFAGTTKAGDIQLEPARRLSLRNGSSTVWTSPVLEAFVWYFVTVRVSGALRMRLYQAGNLWADSGDLATATVGSVDTFRIGLLSSSTARVQFDRLRGDDATEPTPGITPSTAVAAYTSHRVREIDTSGSTGSVTLVQTSGTAATITGPTSGVFRVVLPETHDDELVFTLTATNGADSDTETIILPPTTGGGGGGGGTPVTSVGEFLVFDGTGWR